MTNHLKFYIDGDWVSPHHSATIAVLNPATEAVIAEIAAGTASDAARAVAAARAAFQSFAQSGKEERLHLLHRIVEAYDRRTEDMAQTLSAELGAPIGRARKAQVAAGRAHLTSAIAALEAFCFEDVRGNALIRHEPVGVVGLITPWNWPLNQIACKVAPALAAGCTMVLKPSEIAPLSALIFAEVMHEAKVPKGVFNLVNGDGPSVGQVLASHPEIDMISFTGSTRAGITVAKVAAETVKRISQELGGKSPNILLPDADFERAVRKGVEACFNNSGQSCDAPTRMLVPAERHAEVLDFAARAAAAQVVGDPRDDGTILGPVASATQFQKIQRLIALGIEEGATLVAGGLGRPEGLDRGWFVRPTVFGDVRTDMTIAREEIFGPVLAILPYRDEEEAIAIANDTVYGLAANVESRDPDRALRVARRLRAGQVRINYPPWDPSAPFGGFKQSGNGREYGAWGLHDFLEVQAVLGNPPGGVISGV